MMEFENVSEQGKYANGTSLQGYVFDKTRADLEAAFGSPVEYEEGDKVTLEWILIFDDGVTATIYDWKRYELGTPGMYESVDWNIGGKTYLASERVSEALAKARQVA
jgi:hypothetical protein